MKNKILPAITYLYIALPFLIFAAGFLKWYFALPFALIIVLSVAFSVKASEGYGEIKINPLGVSKLLFGLLLILFIVLLSGIGDFFWQNNDHATRNTVFDILVLEAWPPLHQGQSGEVSLVYYIGFWLPSAVVGKIIGLEAGYIFSVIWATIGIFLIWYLLCTVHKKVVIYPLVIFLFFSGLDIIGHGIISEFFTNLSKLQIGKWAFPQGSEFSYHTEWWARYFQYSSHLTQLFWVFNQCLPVWLATLVLLLEKNNKNLVFIMGLTLLSSTLPFIGLIPVFVWCAVTNKKEGFLARPLTNDIKKEFFSLFTFQNFFGGGVSGIMTFLYLKSNVASSTTASQTSSSTSEPSFSLSVFFIVLMLWIVCFAFIFNKGKKLTDYLYLLPSLPLAFLMAKLPAHKMEYYLLFIVFEVLILAATVFAAYRHSSLYFITVSCLLIVPFFIIGTSIDFCMRASIPLLFILCLFAIQSVEKYASEKKHACLAVLIAVLLIGSITPMREVIRTVEATKYEIEAKGEVINDSISVSRVFSLRNFIGKTENNIFFEIFAK